MPGQVRVGVDVVQERRLRRNGRPDPALARRVLNPAEAAWVGTGPDALERLAACFALKEAVIKCAGGRWDGFAWPQVRVGPWAGRAPCAGGCVHRRAAGALIEGLCDGPAHPARVRWPGGEGCCRPSGAAPAAWGRRSGLVIAVVLAAADPRPHRAQAETVAAERRTTVLTPAQAAVQEQVRRRRALCHSIKDVLTDRLDLETDPDWLTDDQAIMGRGLEIDSVNVIEAVLGIEERFRVTVPDNDLSWFGSVNLLADKVEEFGSFEEDA